VNFDLSLVVSITATCIYGRHLPVTTAFTCGAITRPPH